MTYLQQYREAIRKGDIVAGMDMIKTLDNLIADLDKSEYKYDTRDAHKRIKFIEGCIKLTKAPFYGKPMKLLLWQKAFIEVVYSFKMKSLDTGKWVDRFQEILMLISRKNGKALSLDTKIPTPDGWKTMGDIRVGDFVFGQDGKPTTVKTLSELFMKPMYEVTFEDGTKIKACCEHLWEVQTKGSRNVSEYKPKTNRKRTRQPELHDGGWFTTKTAEMVKDFKRLRKDGKGIEYKYRVPIPDAVEYPEKKLVLSPYTFGVWLGDGTKYNTRITCHVDDSDELMRYIAEEGHQVSYVLDRRSPKVGSILIDVSHYGKRDGRNPMLNALRELGVYKNKHIPEVYLQASKQQRWELLKGLMDTDGTCEKSGQCEFTQKSKVLAFQVLELIRSLGIKASIREKQAFCNGKDCGTVYRITFFVSKENSCFKLKRKADRLKDKLNPRMLAKSIIDILPIPVEPSRCITVDNDSHLYLAGDYTVTHNSETIAAIQLTDLLVGKPGSDIVCSGMDDGTADLAYQAIDCMRLLIDSKSKDTWRNQKGITCLYNNNHIYKLSAGTRQREGRNIDTAGIDEIWSLREDGDIYKSIQQSTSVKESYKIFMFGSEGFVDGFLNIKRAEYQKIIDGEDDTESAKRKLPWFYTQDSEREVWDTDENGISRAWEKSNPSIGAIKKWSYLRDRVDEARKSKIDRVFVLCKDFNFKQNTATVWLAPEEYQYPSKFDTEKLRGAYALGGVDLSETTDMTSAKALIVLPGDDRKYFLSHYWIPESKLTASDDKEAGAKYKEWAQQGLLTISPGNDIDLEAVAMWYWELYVGYGIRTYKCGYDVRFSKEFLRKMDEIGIETELVLQDKRTLNNPLRYLENDLKSQKVYFNENEIDYWCLGNSALESDKFGMSQIVKMPGKRAWRIDGAVTFLIAYEMFRRYRSDIVKMQS